MIVPKVQCAVQRSSALSFGVLHGLFSGGGGGGCPG